LLFGQKLGLILLLMKDLLRSARRFLFFTGKGGVGKTSMSCAAAVALADEGKRVLLISTDPASNLDEVLQTPLSQVPTAVKGVPNLEAFNLNPEAAAREYRERIVGPYRGVLPDEAVKSIEEQLSGACTMEIASFNEFARLLGNDAAIAGYDHVILDTAPTGHTLRLLSLPAAWNDFIANNKTGSSCLGPLSGLKEQRVTYDKTVTALKDPLQTSLVLVTRPEKSALKEAGRASCELAGLGMKNQRLIINGLFQSEDSTDPIAISFTNRCRKALAEMPDELRRLPQTTLPFRPAGFGGIATLRDFASEVPRPPGKIQARKLSPLKSLSSLTELIDKIAEKKRGVILTMGKGGVGKTSVAAAIAVELADRGHEVLLSTTDPAAHIADAVGRGLPNLQVSRIDPAVETKAHVERMMATARTKLDREGLALLEEELRSPCTEEVAVFTAFARTVAEAEDKFVVLDTAPTGHTLLLLDATESYHREVLRNASDMPEAVRQLLPRLRDPDYTRILLVTLPEATPVHEAAQLQQDLRRAGLDPFAWIINQSFAATSTSDPALLAKAQNEARYIEEVTGSLAKRAVLVPWFPEEPVGIESLRQFFAPLPAFQDNLPAVALPL
jgi:arsenite-transporting ATPase